MTKKKLLKHGEAMYAALLAILKEHGSGPTKSEALKNARALVKKMHVRHPDKLPVRAFFVEVYGCPKTYIPAQSSDEAKWAVVQQAPKADRQDLLSLVKIGRAKEYDQWAQTAEKRLHCLEELLEAGIRIENSSTPTASSALPTTALACA